MADTKHTPGPWEVRTLARRHPSTIVQGGSIARIAEMVPGWPEADIQANARLIASAPDMAAELEALKDTDELDGLVLRQADTIARLTEALEAAQWYEGGGDFGPRCGECRRLQADGHENDCIVGQALALAKDAGQAPQGR